MLTHARCGAPQRVPVRNVVQRVETRCGPAFGGPLLLQDRGCGLGALFVLLQGRAQMDGLFIATPHKKHLTWETFYLFQLPAPLCNEAHVLCVLPTLYSMSTVQKRHSVHNSATTFKTSQCAHRPQRRRRNNYTANTTRYAHITS